MEPNLPIKALHLASPPSTGKPTPLSDLGQRTTKVARTVMKRGIEMQRTVLKAQVEQEQVARNAAGGSAVRMAQA